MVSFLAEFRTMREAKQHPGDREGFGEAPLLVPCALQPSLPEATVKAFPEEKWESPLGHWLGLMHSARPQTQEEMQT